MTTRELERLTAFFRREGILRISDNGGGYSCWARGDLLGTGTTITEAVENVLDAKDRAACVDGRAAA